MLSFLGDMAQRVVVAQPALGPAVPPSLMQPGPPQPHVVVARPTQAGGGGPPIAAAVLPPPDTSVNVKVFSLRRPEVCCNFSSPSQALEFTEEGDILHGVVDGRSPGGYIAGSRAASVGSAVPAVYGPAPSVLGGVLPTLLLPDAPLKHFVGETFRAVVVVANTGLTTLGGLNVEVAVRSAANGALERIYAFDHGDMLPGHHGEHRFERRNPEPGSHSLLVTVFYHDIQRERRQVHKSFMITMIRGIDEVERRVIRWSGVSGSAWPRAMFDAIQQQRQRGDSGTASLEQFVFAGQSSVAGSSSSGVGNPVDPFFSASPPRRFLVSQLADKWIFSVTLINSQPLDTLHLSRVRFLPVGHPDYPLAPKRPRSEFTPLFTVLATPPPASPSMSDAALQTSSSSDLPTALAFDGPSAIGRFLRHIMRRPARSGFPTALCRSSSARTTTVASAAAGGPEAEGEVDPWGGDGSNAAASSDAASLGAADGRGPSGIMMSPGDVCVASFPVALTNVLQLPSPSAMGLPSGGQGGSLADVGVVAYEWRRPNGDHGYAWTMPFQLALPARTADVIVKYVPPAAEMVTGVGADNLLPPPATASVSGICVGLPCTLDFIVACQTAAPFADLCAFVNPQAMLPALVYTGGHTMRRLGPLKGKGSLALLSIPVLPLRSTTSCGGDVPPLLPEDILELRDMEAAPDLVVWPLPRHLRSDTQGFVFAGNIDIGEG